jgi:hypothetical protein
MESTAMQPFAEVTFTKYVVVIVGFAMGFAMVVLDKPMLGDHSYREPPEAKSWAELPLQMIVSLEIVIFGVGLIMTKTESLYIQPNGVLNSM